MKFSKIWHFVALTIFACVSLTSCGGDTIHGGKTPIARVYDTYLYYEDLGELIPQGLNPVDSALKVKQYTHVWARQQLMIKMAELHLTPEQKDVKKQLDEYRDNLLIYRYKDEFINENLDTVVSEKQISDYYNSHLADYYLNSPAVKVIFVKVFENSKELTTIRKLLNFNSEVDSLSLVELCKIAAVKYETFDNKWVSLAEASKYMPDLISEKNDALKTRGTIYLSDDDYVYLLKIRECIPAGGTMPLSMAETAISRIIINIRKRNVVNTLEQTILDNALNNKNLEFFSIENTSE